MKIVKLPSGKLIEFLGHLGSFGEVHAPQKKGKKSFAFQPVKDPANVIVSGDDYTRTILPIKKYFHKPVDTLLKFSPKKGFEDAFEDEGKKILFGVHSCDINAILSLDRVFSGEYVDTSHYMIAPAEEFEAWQPDWIDEMWQDPLTPHWGRVLPFAILLIDFFKLNNRSCHVLFLP